jgi:hypothetical protein
MNIVVKQDRLEKMVTVGELLDLQSGSMAAIVNIMSKFVLNNSGAYLSEAEGLERIKSLTLEEMKAVSGDFSKKLTEAAVPPMNGSDSGEPSSQG